MSLTIHQHEAIISLYPQVVTIRGGVAYDKNEQQVTYNENVVQAKVIELQQEKEQAQQIAEANKASALSKLIALGLTADEIKALTGA
jgi:hypothetical protein